MNTSDYYYSDKAMMMTIKAPMKSVDACVLGTKNYIFTVPVKSMGVYGLVTTFKNHQYFQDMSVDEGLRKLISEAESVEALEDSLCALLEDDDKYVYKLDEMNSFKFRGIFGRHTLRMARSKMHWASISFKKSPPSKEFRQFYGQ